MRIWAANLGSNTNFITLYVNGSLGGSYLEGIALLPVFVGTYIMAAQSDLLPFWLSGSWLIPEKKGAVAAEAAPQAEQVILDETTETESVEHTHEHQEPEEESEQQ